MENSQDMAQVLGDYAALLRALFPDACGFRCHGLDGSCIWSEEQPGTGVEPNELYRSSLAALLAQPSAAASCIAVAGGSAYLLGLCNDKEQPLGVLTVLSRNGPVTLTAVECAALLQPATRTLQRELTLRFRLMEGYRKLNVQAAEERLLHEVERAVQGPPECEVMIGRILGLCRRFLQVHSAAVLIPDKKIAVVQGDRFTRNELELMLDNVGNDPSTSEPPPDLFTVGIRGPDRRTVGVLALSGWQGADFSGRRRSRVGRYVATHVETVLERSFDGLTGLMAWPAFEKLLVATSESESTALMYFDIDRLHVANETLGREAGDKVLASFSEIVREELAGHQITRIASDSFAALLMDTDLDQACARGEAIAARFRLLEFGQGDRTYKASVSTGIAIASQANSGEGGPLAPAQVACGAAKDRGRGRVELYQPEDLSLVQRFDDIQLVGYIRNAIDRGRLTLLGQPIVPVKAGGAPAKPYYEVLVRLLDDDDRHVSPAEFLSAAERYQLMEDLDRWVVANTLELLGGALPRLKASRARFAINLSGQSLGSEAFLNFVQEQIAKSRVPPEVLCFEITETVAVANPQRAQAFMHTLRRTGCRFSIDDFGTGLSSFAYLKLFPVDTLKIDGSFIGDLESNVISQSVVAAISEVARVMQLETVAEFVQDEQSLELLGKLGITWAQGYFLGEPAPLVERLTALPGGATAARPMDLQRG